MVGQAVIFDFGNRCGHRPAEPKLIPIEPVPDNLPPAISNSLPAVRELYTSRDSKLRRFGKPRSERREALCLVASFMLAKMDLVTKRVGSRPDEKNRVKGVLDKTIAAGCGISRRRVRRVIRYGREVGFWSSAPTWEEKNGQHKGRAAIRCFLDKFFRVIHRNLAIGFASLQRCKAQAKKKRAAEEAAAAAPATPETIGREAIRMSTRRVRLAGRRVKVEPATSPPTPDNVTDEGQLYGILAQRVRQQHPDWPSSDVYAEVERQIAARRG